MWFIPSLQVALPANLTSITSGSYLPKVVGIKRCFFVSCQGIFLSANLTPITSDSNACESNNNYIRQIYQEETCWETSSISDDSKVALSKRISRGQLGFHSEEEKYLFPKGKALQVKQVCVFSLVNRWNI